MSKPPLPPVRSRQTITTVASIFASLIAVAFPIPEFAPVAMQIFPCILLFNYYHLKGYQKAIGDFDRALALDSSNAIAYYNRGNVYRDLKQY
jgi:tetratricopeptide (TPR) repeat protein